MSTALIRSSEAHPNISQAIQYGRLGISLASIASSLGFLAAKNGTQVGFSIARGLTTSAVSITTSFAERAFLGTTIGTDKLVNFAVSKSFDLAQALTLIPIHIGQAVTDASIVVASTSLESVSLIFDVSSGPTPNYKFSFSYGYPTDSPTTSATASDLPGPFSATPQSFTHAIPSLVNILKHEWQHPQDAEHLPAESYSAISIARAIVAWASIQSVTRLYHEKKWFNAMHEIHDWEWRGHPPQGRSSSSGARTTLENPLRSKGDSAKQDTPRKKSTSVHVKSKGDSTKDTLRKKSSSVHVISDVRLPHHGGEILTAEIGQPSPLHAHSQASSIWSTASSVPHEHIPYPSLRQALRRYSRLVLGGYGGAGMVFFGVKLPSSQKVDRNSGNLSGAFDGAGKTFGLDFVAPNLPPKASSPTESPPPPNLKRISDKAPPALHIDVNFSTDGDKEAVSISPLPDTQLSSEHDETKTLTDVVQGAEDQDDDEPWDGPEFTPTAESHQMSSHPSPPTEAPAYSWWNLLLGKHDREIFEAFATHGTATPKGSSATLPPLQQEKRPASHRPPMVHAGEAERLPRFWVLTDHGRQQIILVLRGTMTLNEVAIDLACAAVPFSPAKTLGDNASSKTEPTPPAPDYEVHEGMYELAKFMGAPGEPVQTVVASALANNEGYELVLCGHSLGAGVCAVLGLMWADPATCLTVHSSGLPPGRRLSVFGFAPPCVMSPSLSRLASSMVNSFAYSHDVITRLSLGSVRDLKRGTSWLCYGQNNDQQGETCSSIISRALILEKGFGFMGIQGEREAEEAWFLSLRKTLEANMTKSDLFPPGRIIWALRDADLHHKHRRSPPTGSPNLPRLFEVEKVEEVFGQIMFSRDMISSHFVQNYDRILQQFL